MIFCVCIWNGFRAADDNFVEDEQTLDKKNNATELCWEVLQRKSLALYILLSFFSPSLHQINNKQTSSPIKLLKEFASWNNWKVGIITWNHRAFHCVHQQKAIHFIGIYACVVLFGWLHLSRHIHFIYHAFNCLNELKWFRIKARWFCCVFLNTPILGSIPPAHTSPSTYKS